MLPMMEMGDGVRGTIQLMEADLSKVNYRISYNLAAMSFTPKQIAAEIKKRIPDFEITYNPDFHQAIADSWPKSIDDSQARMDWGWKPKYDLSGMTDLILGNLGPKLAKG